MSFKLQLKSLYFLKTSERQFWLNSSGLKTVDYESYGEYIIQRNPASDNVSFIVDNKTCLWKHEKLHSSTARKGRLNSETMHRYIEKGNSTRLT